jgi:hypothetical protein
MGGHLEVDELTTAVADEEEDGEGPEGEGLNDEKIGRPDHLSMVGQEGAPALAGWAGMTPVVVTPDRAGVTTMPSLSSSPRIRSVPQRGFWLAMVAINSRISGLNRGRPG